MKKDSDTEETGSVGHDKKSQATENNQEEKPISKSKPEKNKRARFPPDKDKTLDEQKRFLVDLISEAQHFQSLQNNSGKEEPPQRVKRDIVPFIDERDQFTPDNWIPRSPHLTRLTGSHPYNAEPELTKLFDAGFVTPSHLHYVRNHAAVPKLDWDSHMLKFIDPEGLCTDPQEFSMNQIADMEWICIPVTLACDGNRRGEVNRIRRSGGFDWGSCIIPF